MALVKVTIINELFHSQTSSIASDKSLPREFARLLELLKRAEDPNHMLELCIGDRMRASQLEHRKDAFRYALPCGLQIDVSWRMGNPAWEASVFGFLRSNIF
jgi:hypothetical protein